MTEQVTPIKESTKLNFLTSIWMVPIFALFIAAWLAFEYYTSIGSVIKIHFAENAGLTAGQGQIRYKDIPIGKIIDIQMQENGDGVTVFASINSNFSDLINENSKFWIVKPEFSVLGISGLSTLVSGTYIDLYKGNSEKQASEFIGLEKPYRMPNTGNNYELIATENHSLSVGVPVFFKNIEIGQVETTTLNDDGSKVHFIISITKEYSPFVQVDSKFWIKSAVSIDVNDGVLGVGVAPLPALLRGGINLSSSGKNTASMAENHASFELFANKQEAKAYKLGQGAGFVETFEIDTMAATINLVAGAKVKYLGYQVGSVKSVTPYFSGSIQQLKSKVLVDIDLSSFANISTPEAGKARFYESVKKGLRTKVTPTHPLLSELFIDFVFDENAPNQHILEQEPYPVLPTLDVKPMPIKEILANLNQITKNINVMTSKKTFKALPDELTKTMKSLTQTLHAIDNVAKGDGNSALSAQITQTLKSVGQTSKEMHQFLELLNNKPNALVFGE